MLFSAATSDAAAGAVEWIPRSVKTEPAMKFPALGVKTIDEIAAVFAHLLDVVRISFSSASPAVTM